MKKILCNILAVFIVSLAYSSSYAIDSVGGKTTITTTVNASYTVTIPSDTAIEFNKTSTPIGCVSLTNAKLEKGKKVTVTAATNNKLLNSGDMSQTILYSLNSNGKKFESISFTSVGSIPLQVDIPQEEWDNAAAGSYSGTITFTISYDDAA